MPSNRDFALLCKKFEDPVTGDINYPAFCQIVDESNKNNFVLECFWSQFFYFFIEYKDFTHSKIDQIKKDEDTVEKAALNPNNYPLDISTVDLNELMARIRSHCLSHRIRIKEFFQDMDPLNSGQVSKNQFIRCLSSFGISSIGSFNISQLQTEALCSYYKSQIDNTKVNWKKFEEDVESGQFI